MRVNTAFNKLLGLEGAWVRGVRFAERGTVCEVALRRRRAACSGCGTTGLATHDRRRKRWRHLDLGAGRCFIECELRRLRCPGCGVRYEQVPFARAGSPFSADFEDVVAHLAQQMAKTPIMELMRIGWKALGGILERVVAEKLEPARLEGLVLIGVDEFSWRRRHRYLTCVVDQLGGRVVWAAEGRSAETLGGFFSELGPRKQTIMAVSIDMSGGFEKAIREAIPHARICFDPFHVVQLAQRAVDSVRRDEWNRHERSATPHGRWIKGTRWALVKAPPNRTESQDELLAHVQRTNRPPLPGLPAQRAATGDLRQGGRCRGCRRAPRPLARLGFALQAEAVREARADDPPPPRAHRRRRSDRHIQRPGRGAEHQDQTAEQPQLRFPLRGTVDRAGLLSCGGIEVELPWR